MNFKFCPYCGISLIQKSDKKGVKSFCPECGKVFYRNPTAGVAVLLVEAGKILLVKRARLIRRAVVHPMRPPGVGRGSAGSR